MEDKEWMLMYSGFGGHNESLPKLVAHLVNTHTHTQSALYLLKGHGM